MVAIPFISLQCVHLKPFHWAAYFPMGILAEDNKGFYSCLHDLHLF